MEKFQVPTIKVGEQEIPFTIKRAHEYAINRAREDLTFYFEFLMGFMATGFQREWFGLYESAIISNILNIASRGYAKTTCAEVALTWHLGRNPHTSNNITCSSEENAKKRLTSIKDIILYNPRFKIIFPWIEADTRKAWNETEINIVDTRIPYGSFVQARKKTPHTPSVLATGAGGSSITGHRINGWGIIDDLHDYDDAYSPTKRQRKIDWFKFNYLPIFIGNRKLIILTTRWHPEDLAGDLKKTWGNSPYHAVTETPAEYTNEEGERISNWEENFPIERLDQEIFGQGLKFYRAAYLNDVNALSGELFQLEWLNNHLPTPLPEMKKVVISIDPAATVKKASNYTAVCLCGIDTQQNFYLLGLWLRKLHPKDLSTLLQIIFDQAVQDYGHCDKILIEKAGQQQLVVDRVIDDTVTLPVLGVNYPGDKVQKAQSFEVLCSRMKFFADWNQSWANQLRSQLLAFPNEGAEGDDAVDTIAQAANFLFTKNVIRSTLKEIKNPYML